MWRPRPILIGLYVSGGPPGPGRPQGGSPVPRPSAESGAAAFICAIKAGPDGSSVHRHNFSVSNAPLICSSEAPHLPPHNLPVHAVYPCTGETNTTILMGLFCLFLT